MKKFILLSLFAITLSINILIAQQNTKCGHMTSFDKSLISDTLDAIHYNIHLTVTDFSGHEIGGYTDVELASKINNLNEIKLELMSLTTDSVFVDDVEVTGFTHIGNIITIPLSAPLNAGDNANVRVYYHGVPFHEGWGGFHWDNQYAFNLGVGFVTIPHNLGKTWFPCIDDFHDRALYDIYATVEDPKKAVCGGLLLDVVDNGNGTKTYHWKLNHTIPTYLASIAVGDYAVVSDVYNGIEEDIPIEIYVKPADTIKVPGSFVHLKEVLAIYENRWGPYRWSRIGYVGTAIGAMEHVTNIALPHFCIDGGLSCESTIVHELSHMWFGDNVTCASAEDMWLNEGWAVYNEAIYREDLYSEEEFHDFMYDNLAKIIQFCHTSSGDGSYFPLNEIPQNITYGMTAYKRGSTVAHSLRGYLGDDLFFDAMKAYQENFKYNYCSSEDMETFLTGYTGIDMSGFFDNWVFHSGTPQYSIDSFNVVPTGSGADVRVFMRQRRHGPEFTGDNNIVEVTFMDSNWNRYSDTVHFDGASGGSSVKQVPFVPEIALCDYNFRLCDAVTDLNRVIKETGSKTYPKTYFKLIVNEISDSALVRVEHNWAPPDDFKNPIQGVTLSNYRYWRIDGIFPEGFDATGEFTYTKTSFLDDSLLNPNDTVLLLYRTDAGDDWHFIDYSVIGIWSVGKFYVDNLQRGEYTIAVGDDTFTGIEETQVPKKSPITIHPNPSSDFFIIDYPQPGTFEFYDETGNIVDSVHLHSGASSFKWKPEDLPKGTYFVRYLSENNKTIGVEKLIIVN